MARVISAETFRDMLDERRRGERSFVVVDTRPKESFAGWRIPDAIHYFYKPFHTFDVDDFEAKTGLDADTTVVTTCAKGKASLDFAESLESAGYGTITVVEDGMRGWSRVYDRTTIPLPDSDAKQLDIVQIQRRAKGCLGYLVVGGTAADGDQRIARPDTEQPSRVAVAVDVSRHGSAWRDAARAHDATICAVLDTHVHADHLSGGRSLANELGVSYYLPAAAADRGVSHAFSSLEPNETLNVGGVDLKALATPGHTSDMASYLIGRSAVLTGDTLFTDSVGRTELQFGDKTTESDAPQKAAGESDTSTGAAHGAAQLYDSLHRTLLAEPDDIVVCPGHFAVANDGTTGAVVPGEPVVTTVGSARQAIDVLALTRSAFVDRITATVPEKPPNYESIIAANRGVESPSDTVSAIELELGPNRCAADSGTTPGTDSGTAPAADK